MKKRVLLFVDNSKRDLLATRLLEISLQNLGVSTKLCNLKNWRVVFRQFRPHAVISSRGDHKWTKEASKCCRVYIVPSEGCRLTKETMLSVFMGRAFFKLDRVDWIRRCYLWNENTQKWLLESGFKPEQLKVVGNIRLDPYRYDAFKKKEFSKDRDFVLGVAFSAKATSTYYGSPNHAQSLFNFHPDFNFPIAAEGRHYEDLVWRDFIILRLMMRYLRRYLETMPGKVLFRPSPFEDYREYLFLEKLYPGRVKVLPNQQLIDWMSQVDAIMTCWSTVGIEALVHKIPLISISKTIDQEHLHNHVNKKASGFDSFVGFYHLPESEDELFKMMQQAHNGELAASPKSETEVVDEVHKLYNWPFEQDASEQIATDIVEDLKDAPEAPKSLWQEVFPIKWNMPLPIARLAYYINALKDFAVSGAFKAFYDFSRLHDPRVEDVIRRLGKK